MKILDLFRGKGSRITTAKDLFDELTGALSSYDSAPISTDSAMRYAAVYTAIRVLSESVGMLPCVLYERDMADRRVKNKARDNRLWELLRVKPNEYMTSVEFFETVVTHLGLRGNFYALKTNVGTEVRELLPMNPGAVEPFLDENFRLRYRVTFDNGAQDIMNRSQVWHVKLFSIDGINGLSPIGYMRESIQLGLNTMRYGSKLFTNGAKPSGILSTEQTLKQEQIDRIKKSWHENYGGLSNAHRTAVLEAGLKWTATAMTAEDAQFLETRKFQRSEIAGIYRVPPHMLGDLDKATFSNIEHQAQQFVNYSLMPILTRIEARINADIIPPSKRPKIFAKFNANALLRGDMKTRSEFYTKLQNAGALSPNEIRAFEDMNPRPGGDEYLTPLNMATSGEEDEDEDEDESESESEKGSSSS